jgi:hypothetical protein
VADTSYAALDLLAWCARQARPVTVIEPPPIWRTRRLKRT